MKKNIRDLVLALSLFMLVPFIVDADTQTFTSAVDHYKAGNYDSTIIIIRDYLRKHGRNPESEKLVPLITEALIRKGRYESVHRLISMFNQKFPQSSFLPRLWYLEGVAFAKEEKYPHAILSFSKALDAGVSRELDSLTVLNTEKICERITHEEIDAIKSYPLHYKLLEIVSYYEIQKLFEIGQFVKAQNYADLFQKTFVRSKYGSTVQNISSISREKGRNTLQIGILAPLSGYDSEIGKRIVQGIQLAINQYNSSNVSSTVKGIILDTKGDMIETARRTRELVEEHRVPVIIGPILSHTAAITASMLMGKQTVMISPTATDDGIAELGDNLFQMNLTMGVLGRKIARYAIEYLNIKEFAIMAPNTQYGMVLARSFKDELNKRNAEIVAEEYFEEGGNDFTSQFKNMRSKLLHRHLEKIAIDRGTDFRGVTKADSIKYADSTLAVDGLFIPADAADIVMVAPQVYFHRIRTQMLGSNGWHNPEVLKEGKRYVHNAMISTGFEVNPDQREWQEFRKKFKAKYNYEPDRIVALGFDAAMLTLKSLKTAGDDPQKIANVLSTKVQNYIGLSGTISFDSENGTNIEAAVFKVTENGFIKVQ